MLGVRELGSRVLLARKSRTGGEDQYGLEVLTELNTFLSENRGKLMVVIAGYEDRMEKTFGFQPGLDRRFPHKLCLTSTPRRSWSRSSSTC